MSRRAWLTLATLLAAGAAFTPAARSAGQWTTYLHPGVGTDILAMRDSVLISTRDAGILRYLRGTCTWESITHEPNGLAGNDVEAITFDRTGNLFASVPGKGVSRLDRDGRWTLINTFDGLPSDTALTLRAQGDTVWIGTTRGLALWDGTTIAGSVPDLGTPSPFLDNNINGIAITGDTLFVSSPRGVQIARLSQQISTWTTINDGLPRDRTTNPTVLLNVTGLACDGHNVLTVASGANPGDTTQNVVTGFRWFPTARRWSGDSPTGNSQLRRLRDDFGTILGTVVGSSTLPSGTFRWGPGGWTLLPGSLATDLNDAFEGGVEMGADPAGVVFEWGVQQMFVQTGTTFTAIIPPGPVGNDCRNVMVSNGSVYALYFGEGVSRFRNGIWRNYPAGPGCALPACDPDTTFAGTAFPFGNLLDPAGVKWISVWDGPLVRFDDDVDPPVFRNIRFNSGDAKVVHQHSCGHALAADSTAAPNAGIWDGLDTDNDNPALGIDLYTRDGTFVRNYNAELADPLIRALAVDQTNQMWVGYNAKGLATFPVPDTLGENISVSQITGTERLKVFGIAAHRDSIWVLADDGLHRYTPGRTATPTPLAIAGAPALLGVRPVAVAKDGTVYVGTTAGLRVHRRGERAVDFTPENSPLADLEVRGIWVEPSGVAWIGTAAGLNRYDPNFVPSAPPKLATLQVTLYPNPTWQTGVGFELRVTGKATSYDGEIFDVRGRLVQRFHAGGNGAVVWNGTDGEGARVDPGIYFVRLRGGGAEATSRVVVLR